MVANFLRGVINPRALALLSLGILVIALSGCAAAPTSAGGAGGVPKLSVALDGARGAVDVGIDGSRDPSDVSVAIQIVALLTVLSLAPALLVMVTSFTRIIVVLGFIRSALGVPMMPPNQVMVGLGLFLTMFVMMPTITPMPMQTPTAAQPPQPSTTMA